MISSQKAQSERDRIAAIIQKAKDRIAAATRISEPIPPVEPINGKGAYYEAGEIEFISQQFPSIIFESGIISEIPQEPSEAESLVSSIQESLGTIPKEISRISWDSEQQEAINLISSGKSCCIIGAAGTGKTTLAREGLRELISSGRVPILNESTKWLTTGLPGVVVLSYTNRAVANIAKGMPKDITCVTAHKLIEFKPEFYDAKNAAGELVKTMRFEPSKTRFDPLPRTLVVVVVEEGGTVGTDLWKMICDAIPNIFAVQFIFLGDINQLTPVFGPAILGFKMIELPTIELKTVHRQAGDCPFLWFAWEMLEGKPMSIDYIRSKYAKEGDDRFIIRPWKKSFSQESACLLACRVIDAYIEDGTYNPMEDIILVPFGKPHSFGSWDMNLHIAQTLGDKRNAEVHEIIAGYTKRYMAIGDKVLIKKQEAIITKLSINADYRGTSPLPPSNKLSRWGIYNFDNKEEAAKLGRTGMTLEQMEEVMAIQSLSSGSIEEKQNQASHVLYAKFIDSDEEVSIQTTGEFADCLFAYALTVYKSQGSEWKRVFLFLHQSHATAICRELLYTAVTRARENIVIICEPDHFEKGVLRQDIKGNTLAEKAEYFKGKYDKLIAEGD